MELSDKVCTCMHANIVSLVTVNVLRCDIYRLVEDFHMVQKFAFFMDRLGAAKIKPRNFKRSGVSRI